MHHPLVSEFVGFDLEGYLAILLLVLFGANATLHHLDCVHDFLGISFVNAGEALYRNMLVYNPCSSKAVAPSIARLEMPFVAFTEAKSVQTPNIFVKMGNFFL